MDSQTASNPLADLAVRLPAALPERGSAVLRFAGALVLFGIAANEDYDPTQIFAMFCGLVGLATLVPLPRRGAPSVSLFGAGMLFFAGAVLTHMGPGVALLLLGAGAGVSGFAALAKAGRSASVPALAFLVAVFVTGAAQAAVVFAVE